MGGPLRKKSDVSSDSFQMVSEEEIKEAKKEENEKVEDQIEIKFTSAFNIQKDYLVEIQNISLMSDLQDKAINSPSPVRVEQKLQTINCREWKRLFMVCD